MAPAHARRYQHLAADKSDAPVRLMRLDESAHLEPIAPRTDAARVVVDRIAEEAIAPGRAMAAP